MLDFIVVQLALKLQHDRLVFFFLAEQLKDRAFYLEVLDKTAPDYSLEELAEEPSLRGAFVSEMLERIAAMSGEEKEIGLRAVRIGLEAMEGGQNG